MTIKIHPIQTGTVKIKVNQTRRAENLWPPLVNLFWGREWTDWLPIYAWVIEHPEGLFVVDTGETARTTSEPGYFPKWQPYYRFAVRFNVQPENEIGPQIRRLGFAPDDVTYFLAGDTSYTQMLMQQGIPDGVGTTESINTLRLIQQFTGCFPTIYLPSHEADAKRRLNEKITVAGNQIVVGAASS